MREIRSANQNEKHISVMVSSTDKTMTSATASNIVRGIAKENRLLKRSGKEPFSYKVVIG